jgi:hypothetical protein
MSVQSFLVMPVWGFEPSKQLEDKLQTHCMASHLAVLCPSYPSEVQQDSSDKEDRT